jgi:phage terminase large subunit-like protein
MTQKTPDLWEALTTSQGSREQPLIFAISTAGFDQESVCFRQHELARQVAEGTVEAPGFLGVIYGAAMDADWTEEAVWRAANPSLGETASNRYGHLMPGSRDQARARMDDFLSGFPTGLPTEAPDEVESA